MKKEQLLLYGITDDAWVGEQTLYQQVEAALKGGATIIQLRKKNRPYNEVLAEAKEMVQLCHKYKVPLIINDSAKLAIESGADGVHMGQEDGSVTEVRRMVSDDFIIGVTAKTVAQAVKAQAEGANYLGVGAVFPSPTKPDAIRITKEQLLEISQSVEIPIVAIGGISYDNMLEIQGSGIAGIAVVSAIFAAKNIEETTSKLVVLAKRVVKGTESV